MLVTTKESAPGGARVRKVTLPPDEALLGHMAEHGVFIDTGVLEEDRLKQAFWIQVGVMHQHAPAFTNAALADDSACCTTQQSWYLPLPLWHV